jgi:hypothetical protein
MSQWLETHQLDLMCRVLQQKLSVTFDEYGTEAGSQLQLVPATPAPPTSPPSI